MASKSNHKQVLAEIEDDLFDAAVDALNATMSGAISHVRDDGDLTQPFAKTRISKNGRSYYWYDQSGPRRQAHPGNWADVTGLTSNSYDFEQANIDQGNIVGALFNTAPHAEHLEGKRRKEGGTYWVLDGLLQDDSGFNIARRFEQIFSNLLGSDE